MEILNILVRQMAHCGADYSREVVKAKIQDIYDESKQNYDVPKITKELRKLLGKIISECTIW